MSKQHKTNRNSKAITPPQTSRRTGAITAIIILALAIVTSLGFCWWKSNHSTVAAHDFQKLKGKWLRPDGGYVLEVRQVAADGRIDASYLNPRPINVTQAAATSEAGQLKVFVELRDRLYPGNYYTLTYDAGHDQMSGVYHHLGIQQQFDVVFVRMK
jgi:hypothetical protein